VLQEASSVTDLQNLRPQIESALSLPGVVGFSLRFRWKTVDSDFSLLDQGLAVAQTRGKAFSVRAMAGRHTPERVFDAGSPYYVLTSGEKVPAPFYPDGSPNTLFEQAYDEFVGRLAAWSRANGVKLLHLPWYGQEWSELNHGAEVRAAPGYTLNTWLEAHRRLIDIAARHSGADLAVEMPLSGSGPLANGPSAALADHVIATVGADSDRFFVQANGWGPNGDWGTTSATTEAQFDQIWLKPVRRGEQAIQPQDYDWTLLYGYLYANDATYAEVYTPSFSLARKDLLAAEIARFASTRCAAFADTTPPLVVVSAPAVDARVAGGVGVSVDATDGEGSVTRVEVLVDGSVVDSADAASATIPWDTITVADGPHELSARALDDAGNLGLSSPVAVIVDNTAPAVPGDVTTTPGDARVTVAFPPVGAGDLAGYEVRSKISSSPDWDSPVATASTRRTFFGLVNGTSYDFSVRSCDTLGNTSAWSTTASATPTPDTQAPMATVTSPPDGALVVGVVVVSMETSDAEGSVIRVELVVDGDPAGSAEAPSATVDWDTSAVADGIHVLSARAVDDVGNVGHSSPVTVTVDNTAPAVPGELTALPGDRQVRLTFQSVDASDLGGYEARMKPSSGATWGAPQATTSPSWTFTGLTGGRSYDFTVRSHDILGNASAWSDPVSATPTSSDTEAPTVAVSAPVDGARVAGTVPVSMEASDAEGSVVRVELLADGDLAGSADTAPATIGWDSTAGADGTHVLSARAVDDTGNLGTSAPVSVTVDNTAPPVPGGLTATPGNAQVTVSFAAVSAADLAGYDLRMKASSSSMWGAPVATTSTSRTFTGLVNGTSYDFSVRSRDTLGHVSAWSAAVKAIPDAQAPTTPTGLSVTQRNRTSIQICWSLSTDNVGVAGYQVSRNGVLVATTTSTCHLVANLTPGTAYTLSVRSFDAAGNLSGTASVKVRTRP
jgi:chitodextrinase